jgi:hypothetical protein
LVRLPAKYDEFIKIGIDEDENIDKYVFIISTEELHIMKYNKAMSQKTRKVGLKPFRKSMIG